MTGKELRAARKQLGLSQTELAKKLGLTQAFISRMELGIAKVDVRTEMSVKFLLCRKEK